MKRQKKNTGLAYIKSDAEFIETILSSPSCAAAMRLLGFSCIAGNARSAVKRRISELGISTEHWQNAAKKAHFSSLVPHDLYFAKDTPHSGGHIRERVLKYNLLPYECEACGNNGEWQGKELRLQVDHINGDHNDNRLTNLRFLCPNCHAQTETFAGKNVKT